MEKTSELMVQEKIIETHELADEAWSIFDKLRRASLLFQNVTEEYFEKYNQGIEKDQEYIIFEFDKCGLYVDMIFDYIIDAKREVKELSNNLQLYHETMRQKETSEWELIDRSRFNKFTVNDMKKFRDTFFPHLTLDQLFDVREVTM